jgi:membrane-bound lytic murein transglycosylase A
MSVSKKTSYILPVILTVLVGFAVFYLMRSPEKGYFTKVSFGHLKNWHSDQHEAALTAFQISCVKILEKEKSTIIKPLFSGGRAGDWFDVCGRAQKTIAKEAKNFFEEYFTALKFNPESDTEEMQGTFTGYYAPEYDGSPVKTDLYNIPLYKVPSDLQVVSLGDFDVSLKGKYIIGQVSGQKFTPYKDRKIIDEGALKDQGLELVWLKSPTDCFFLEIQGSGVIKFEDGTRFQVSYAGKNGRPYRAIGRYLIESGDVKREDMSMQAIRAWLEENPDKAKNLLWKNPSFVFFKTQKEVGTVGAMGVNLTAGRSLAVDNNYIPYGAPLWLETVSLKPRSDEKVPQNLSRLVIAQDTGGAIRGKMRGDVFWGVGDRAAELAGPMNDKGHYYLLLPHKLAQNILDMSKKGKTGKKEAETS